MGWVVFSAVEGTWRECGLQFPSSFRIHILEVMIDYEGFFFSPYSTLVTGLTLLVPSLLVFTNDPCVDQRWFQLGSGRTTVLTRLSM